SFRAVLEGHLDRKSHVIGGSDDGKEYDRLIDSTITETGSFVLFYLLYYNPGGTEGDYGIHGLTEESSIYDWSVDSVFTVEDTHNSKLNDDIRVTDAKTVHMFDPGEMMCEVDQEAVHQEVTTKAEKEKDDPTIDPDKDDPSKEDEEFKEQDPGTLIDPNIVLGNNKDPEIVPGNDRDTGSAGAIAAGVGGVVAAAGIGAGVTLGKRKKKYSDMNLDELYDEDTRDYSQFRMILYKDFGDCIKRDTEGVWVMARIEEYRPVSDIKLTRDDLTRQIRSFSGDGHLTVEDKGIYTHGCDWAAALVTVPKDQKEAEGKVSFTFTGAGGTFTRHVVFRILGEPGIAYLVDGPDGKPQVCEKYEADIVAVRGVQEKFRFYFYDVPEDPQIVRFTETQGLTITCEKDPNYEHAYMCTVRSDIIISPEDRFYAAEEIRDRAIRVTITGVFKDKSEVENDFTLTFYPEGIVAIAEKRMINEAGRLIVSTLPNPNKGKGLEMDISPTYFDLRIAYVDEKGSSVVSEEATVSVAKDLEDGGAYGLTFTDNFEYNIRRANGGSFLLAPRNTLPMVGKPYEVVLPVTCSQEGPRQERKLPLTVIGEAPAPPLDADIVRELELLKKTIAYFGLDNSDPVLIGLVRNARYNSADQISFTRYCVIAQGVAFYEKQSRAYQKLGDTFRNMEIAAMMFKWAGDRATEVALQLYMGKAGGKAVAAFVNPVKNILAEFYGAIGFKMLCGEEIELENTDLYKALIEGMEGTLSEIITGDLAESVDNLGQIVALYIITCFVKHYYFGEGDEKGDIYKSLICAFGDLGMAHFKSWLGDKIKDVFGKLGDSLVKYIVEKCGEDSLWTALGEFIKFSINEIIGLEIGSWSMTDEIIDRIQELLDDKFGLSDVVIYESIASVANFTQNGTYGHSLTWENDRIRYSFSYVGKQITVEICVFENLMVFFDLIFSHIFFFMKETEGMKPVNPNELDDLLAHDKKLLERAEPPVLMIE
ncbi:MAG: hypothetical protein IK096_03155, partial [Lachnospiraceae bacterium]|nr:hypothetical protein [Lachnospiraceae bacterium]